MREHQRSERWVGPWTSRVRAGRVSRKTFTISHLSSRDKWELQTIFAKDLYLVTRLLFNSPVGVKIDWTSLHYEFNVYPFHLRGERPSRRSLSSVSGGVTWAGWLLSAWLPGGGVGAVSTFDTHTVL